MSINKDIKSNINLNIKSIPAFESINDSSLKKIEKEAQILKFSVGQRLSLSDIISDAVRKGLPSFA